MISALVVALAVAAGPTFDQLAAKAVKIDTQDRERFKEDFWMPVTANYYPGDNEFETRRAKEAALAKQPAALARWYRFRTEKVTVSEYDFTAKQFHLVIPGLITTEYGGTCFSFQDIDSVSGDVVTEWFLTKRKALKEPTLVLQMKSDREAEAWKKANPKVAAEFICMIGKRWNVGSLVDALDGLALKHCSIRFFGTKGRVLGELQTE